MNRPLLFLTLMLVAVTSAYATDEQPELMLLHLPKQPVESLSYFVRHAPATEPDSPEKPVEFEPLKDGITAHLSEVGYLAGRRLIAIRYLTDARLDHGNGGAVGLVLLCNATSDHSRFSPLVATWRDEGDGLVDDLSVSEVRQLADFSFVWLRRDYSGTSNLVARMAITAPDAESPFRTYTLFSEVDPLAELITQGWEHWHRGNHFDEASLTWHFHLHREKGPKGEYPHRLVRVRYTFRDGKLHPGKPEDVEND